MPVGVVLGSSSPTRRRLLRRILSDFEVVPPRIDESELEQEPGRHVARRLAEWKAADVASRRPCCLVIAADTLVVCAGESIGKPADRPDAVRMLNRLTQNGHEVITGLCVRAPDGRLLSGAESARIRLRRMSQEEVEAYVDCPGALDRAGVYALQPDDPNVESMNGAPSTVMGLPLGRLVTMLRELYPESVPEDGAARIHLDH